MARDASAAAVIQRLKDVAKGDARAYESMTTQLAQARERLDRSREISATIEASLRAETTRKRALVEVFVREDVAMPPAPTEDARSAAVDASIGVDLDVEDGNLDDLEECKAALARSQARARVSLARARRARAHNETLEAALVARGIVAP